MLTSRKPEIEIRTAAGRGAGVNAIPARPIALMAKDGADELIRDSPI